MTSNKDDFKNWKLHPYTQIILGKIREAKQDKIDHILSLSGRPSDELVRMYNQVLGGLLTLEEVEDMFKGDEEDV